MNPYQCSSNTCLWLYRASFCQEMWNCVGNGSCYCIPVSTRLSCFLGMYSIVVPILYKTPSVGKVKRSYFPYLHTNCSPIKEIWNCVGNGSYVTHLYCIPVNSKLLWILGMYPIAVPIPILYKTPKILHRIIREMCQKSGNGSWNSLVMYPMGSKHISGSLESILYIAVPIPIL